MIHFRVCLCNVLAVLLVPVALMGEMGKTQQNVDLLKPLQALATNYMQQAYSGSVQLDTEPLMKKAFKETFMLICDKAVQQKADLHSLTEWLRGTELEQNVQRLVDQMKEQMQKVYDTNVGVLQLTSNVQIHMMEHGHGNFDSTLTREELADTIKAHQALLQQQLDTLESEQKHFYLQCETLISLLEQEQAETYLGSASQLYDAVEAEANMSYPEKLFRGIKNLFA